MVTLRDVAREVGTSVSTVSRVVRNSGHVNDELQERIHQACDRLGYIPNSNAKNLRNGKSNTIGIIVSDINNYFYNITLGHLVNRLREHKYQVLIGYSYENVQIEMEVLEMLLANRVDAIIMTPVSDQNKRLIDTIKKRNIPIVQLYRKAYKGIDSICVDDSYGAYLAANHLIGKGYRRIGLLSINIKFTPHRSEGYRQAYKEHDLPLEEDLILKLPPNVSTEEEIKRFIIKNNPDAIIAGTNLLGIDTLKAIKSLKIKDFKESHLVVFDDMPWMELLDVAAVSQPIELLAQKCVDIVLDALAGKAASKVIEDKVTPCLVVRKK
ncbi:DNA-binding LacI/PurR family transcriptional regulator [Anaerotaenia torta]|uniref:LacI family DNA-binding transcriptional regulator n=1 Tax=Anaerotaenia torta TaxID=433293 RepID=UPI003D2267BF